MQQTFGKSGILVRRFITDLCFYIYCMYTITTDIIDYKLSYYFAIQFWNKTNQ